MPEILQKLRPDQDLQCYFERPSAAAAISGATEDGFTVSGSWRQQFDWAVVEWNRDNVFEHPVFRNLPDGNLNGLVLTYEETRENCIPMDSALFPTVDWPFLRVWSETASGEEFHRVKLYDPARAFNYAEPIEGTYGAPVATFTLGGGLTVGDVVGLAWQGEQYNHEVQSGESFADVAQALVDAINVFSSIVDATRSGASIQLSYVGPLHGAEGNRVGVYGYVSGDRTEEWTPQAQNFAGGTSPSKWRVTLDFSNLKNEFGDDVPTERVRKMRWTYAADLQNGAYVRSDFAAHISNWSVSGTGRTYQVAGRGSRRIDDEASEVAYSGTWQRGTGNFSGGSLRFATLNGASLSVSYRCDTTHVLYLGTRRAAGCGDCAVSIDGGTAETFHLHLAGEDVLLRQRLGELAAGEHSVTLTHTGVDGEFLYFDFLEIATPTSQLPSFGGDPKITLATDWDTDHSIALPAERTAWNIYDLGYHGRVNHYVGALWFYELVRKGHQYASGTVTFTGEPVFSATTTITINRVGQPAIFAAVLNHVNLLGETAENIAKAFEQVLNSGFTAVRAEAVGNVLTIYSRSMGEDGNEITLSASPATGSFTAIASGETLSGGANGEWRTDLTASPRINRAARDWSRAFYRALKARGLDVVAAFSTELQHGDPSEEEGIAQRYPSNNAVLLNTPALQTNFSPVSLAYWREVHRDMATIMAEAECVPYLQFGEVQWWYFPYDGSGLPFADQYTKETFEATYGFPIRTIADGFANPAAYPEEAAFLPDLIGQFTDSIMEFVRGTHPSCRFEVLFPTDVNEGSFNRVINYAPQWTPAKLDCMKTESFTFTFIRDLEKCLGSMQFPISKGFARAKRSHLIGIADSIAPWLKETRLAVGENIESVVLFAFDQFCLIGYPNPLPESLRTAREQG